MSNPKEIVFTELLEEALALRATDMHINVNVEQESTISIRVDGYMRVYKYCSYNVAYALSQAIFASQGTVIADGFDPLLQNSGFQSIKNPSESAGVQVVEFVSLPTHPWGSGFQMILRLLKKARPIRISENKQAQETLISPQNTQ